MPRLCKTSAEKPFEGWLPSARRAGIGQPAFVDGNMHLATVRWLPPQRGYQRKTPVVYINRGFLFPHRAAQYQNCCYFETASGDDVAPSAMILTSVSRLVLRFLRFSLRTHNWQRHTDFCFVQSQIHPNGYPCEHGNQAI